MRESSRDEPQRSEATTKPFEREPTDSASRGDAFIDTYFREALISKAPQAPVADVIIRPPKDDPGEVEPVHPPEVP
jgi:hypothetical protein